MEDHEGIWRFLRQDYLGNRVFDTDTAVVDACCAAWNTPMGQRHQITSAATRSWAQPVTI